MTDAEHIKEIRERFKKWKDEGDMKPYFFHPIDIHRLLARIDELQVEVDYHENVLQESRP